MDQSIRPRNPIAHPARMQPTNIQLHAYDIITVPRDTNPEDVDMLASANKLPRTRIRSISAEAARKTAMHVLRERIHEVVKVVEEVPA